MKQNLFAFASLLIIPVVVWAHGVNLFPYREGDDIHVEGYFSSGDLCKNSEIQVYDQDGKLILSGKTDEEGRFSFPDPEVGDLKIVMIASVGHRTEVTLPGESPNEPVDVEIAPSTEPENANLDEIVSRAVQRAIEPLARSIQIESRESRIRDAISGLGFILGIWGTAALVLSRRQKRD